MDGEGVHALRHCSVKQIGNVLMEMQQHVGDLQNSSGRWDQAVSIS